MSKEQLKRAFDIYNKQTELITKLMHLQSELKDEIDLLLLREYPEISRVYWQGYPHYDSFWFDTKTPNGFETRKMIEVEDLSGFQFERKPYDDRYSFIIKRKEPDISKDLDKMLEVIEKGEYKCD